MTHENLSAEIRILTSESRQYLVFENEDAAEAFARRFGIDVGFNCVGGYFNAIPIPTVDRGVR